MSWDIREVEPGVFSALADDGRSVEARVEGDTVAIAGRRYTVRATDPRKWQGGTAGSQAHGRSVAKAPMPGKIVRVLVRPNEEVQSGQGLVVVEAMKMQNELKSGRAGRVLSVHVSEGDTVEAGASLVVVE